MRKKLAMFGALTAILAGTVGAQEPSVPKGIGHLDHVFVIMMENHGYYQIIGNPNEPYLNELIASKKINLATNYYGVGHPSLTNYLEIVGGSNFGVRSDNAPLWHDSSCTPNIASGAVNADSNGGNAPANITLDTGKVCPIAGSGTDADTPAIDNWNEISPEKSGLQFLYLANIDGVKSVPAATTEGKTIADQLAEVGLSWKSYQENLPLTGADGVNYSNGTVSNLDFDKKGNSINGLLAPLTSSTVLQAYAVKHNPFAYFKSIQEGTLRHSSLENIVGFTGPNGLYSDLASGDVPSLSFIAPNQCNDQHGRGNGDAFCAFDFGIENGLTVGTREGLNPGLIQQGDNTIERLVTAIKASSAWRDGRNAIVIVWDENDYSGSAMQSSGLFPPQTQNKVVLTVETNYSKGGVKSGKYYNSFSLLKSLEAGFGLRCLNHACDGNGDGDKDDRKGVAVMSDLFGQ